VLSQLQCESKMCVFFNVEKFTEFLHAKSPLPEVLEVSFSEDDRTECQEPAALWSGASDWLAFKAA
jgi:hypothetical protein